MTTVKTVDEKDLESSREEESEWGLKKLLKKDQIKLQESFRVDTEKVLKYLTALKALTEAIQKLNVSGKSYHIDQKKQVPYSGWRYLSGYMKKVEFVGSKNKADVDGLVTIFNKIGFAEERTFGLIRNPDEKSNIFLAANAYRNRMETLDQAITISLKTCNRRRKKVEKAAIIQDLKDQCPKYKTAILQLDAEFRELENYKMNVRNNLQRHHNHIVKSLCITSSLSKEKAAIVQKKGGGKDKEANSSMKRKV